MIKPKYDSLEDCLTQLRTLIVSIEADMSLGCLSTTPTQSIIERLNQVNQLVDLIQTTFNYDASFMATHSAYVTMAKRKYIR